MHYKKSLILTLPILLSLSCKDNKKKVRSGYIEAKGNSTDSVDPNSILNKKACTTEFIQHCAEIQSKIDKNLLIKIASSIFQRLPNDTRHYETSQRAMDLIRQQ
ncbi:MAG: hypothetical protein NTX25_19920 [Proteobacteria bacterium]|nr:hypothetical protein [Pseudomonadota bacterium]